MSNWNDCIQVFPSRCLMLLERFEAQAERDDLEVTLLISVATAGLTIPFERLRQPANANFPHPSGDRAWAKNAAEKLDHLLNKPFLGSVLWGKKPGSWQYAKEIEVLGQEVEAYLGKFQPVGEELTVGKIVRHIRNGLAHGNIKTLGDPIENLLLFSRVYEGTLQTNRFNVVSVSPGDFHCFIVNWIRLLQQMRLPAGVMQETELSLIEPGA